MSYRPSLCPYSYIHLNYPYYGCGSTVHYLSPLEILRLVVPFHAIRFGPLTMQDVI